MTADIGIVFFNYLIASGPAVIACPLLYLNRIIYFNVNIDMHEFWHKCETKFRRTKFFKSLIYFFAFFFCNSRIDFMRLVIPFLAFKFLG